MIFSSSQPDGNSVFPGTAAVVSVSVGGETLVFTGAQLNSQQRVSTVGGGQVRVTLDLNGPAGEKVHGERSFTAENDREWFASFSVGPTNPTVGCFGCLGYLSFPIPASAQMSPKDSAWLVWSGNSISNPVIF